ncbi:MAG: response regulator [Flavobacteriales bacterium]|nr:response regulator [Flavobacteriales bacterium]
MKTILIVEDSKILSEIIAVQVKQKIDCETLVFENADHVMKQIQTQIPNLIILDYRFNDTELQYNNGLDFLIELRKNYTIPVIVFSGQNDKQKAVEIMKSGANDYISKDEDDFMDDLLKSIKDLI